MQIDYDLYKNMCHSLAATIDAASYMQSLGWICYPWQREVLSPHKRLILKCPRQSGKSTVIAAKAGHRCKHYSNSLVMIFAPTENQAVEVMNKIGKFLTQDPEIDLERNSTVEKKFRNGSRIMAFTANPTSARGYSDPDMIIFDEAAYVTDELYLTVRPMMTGGITELILLSTPHGKTGFFYETWTKKNAWKKVQVDVEDILHEEFPEEFPKIDCEERRKKLKTKGIDAFVSDRHGKEFLREELGEGGVHWYRQEYGGEFLDPQDSVFDFASVLRGFETKEQALDMDGFSIEFAESKVMWG